MSYDPKIYIRDYGIAARRLLAVPPAEIQIAGPTLFRLAGDQQTGSDYLAFSGETGRRRLPGSAVRVAASNTTLS